MLFIIVAAIYVLIIVGTSFYLSRRETRDDFLIAGRHLSALPLAISLSTSWLGGGALVLMLYFVVHDLPSYLFLALGAVTNLIVFSFLVKKPYRIAVQNNWITMTEMVNGMIGKKSAIFVLFFVFILFSVWFLFEVIGSALILSGLTPLAYEHAVILLLSAIFLYLFFGGFKSIIRTDLIQYGLMIFMVIACFYLAKDTPPIDIVSYFKDKPSLNGFHAFLAGFFGFFALQFSESTIWQRILAAKSEDDAQKALLYTGGFYVLNYSVLIGLIMLGLAHAPELQDEKLFYFIAYDALPAWLGALFLVSILGIMMSTIDTIMFIAAQCFSTDAAHVFGKKLDHPRYLLRLSIVVLCVGVGAVCFITQDIQALFWFVIALWASLVPIAYILSPFEKRPSDVAILTSMVLLAGVILSAYVMDAYQEHYVAYVFVAGLTLPLLLDKIGINRLERHA